MASKDRLSGIGERINVRLTLLEEALGMTPGASEIYSKWIASKAPEPELGEEETAAVEGTEQPEDATTCFPRTEDGEPFCWDYQIKGFFKDAETVREWLDYGRLRGLFQWRNSGKGRFEWEEV